MLRTTLASSRILRACIFGLVTTSAAVIFTNDTADARRHRHHAQRHHHEARESYSPAFSSIIVDGNSGATLSSTSPDASRHPASLTKIMTLYLLFERLDAGKMKLDTEMDVSEHASEQAPTKLGLRPGQTIRVEDAIKGLVTRSANDAAVVIAEAVAGDEGDFAKLMTRKARALGMTKTVYRNASGLPDDEQVTTARDQSTLGRAIQDRFPRYYRYFSTTAFNYHGHSIRNHNKLLGSVEGVDGIKTGYTHASGFNLVTSMRAAAAARVTPSCAACSPKISKRPRPSARLPRSQSAIPRMPMLTSPKPRPRHGRRKRFRFRSPPPSPPRRQPCVRPRRPHDRSSRTPQRLYRRRPRPSPPR